MLELDATNAIFLSLFYVLKCLTSETLHLTVLFSILYASRGTFLNKSCLCIKCGGSILKYFDSANLSILVHKRLQAKTRMRLVGSGPTKPGGIYSKRLPGLI